MNQPPLLTFNYGWDILFLLVRIIGRSAAFAPVETSHCDRILR